MIALLGFLLALLVSPFRRIIPQEGAKRDSTLRVEAPVVTPISDRGFSFARVLSENHIRTY
jgi:hypothetical protein